MRTTLPALSKPPIMGGLFNPVPICRRRERLKEAWRLVWKVFRLLEQTPAFAGRLSGALSRPSLACRAITRAPECALFNFPARGRRC